MMDMDMDMELEHAVTLFRQGEALFAEGNYSSALEIFEQLKEVEPLSAVSYFRLGFIANVLGDAQYSSDCFYKAISINPAINAQVLPKDHPLHLHVYNELPAKRYMHCPLCGATGKPYWCYYIATQRHCPADFSPVKTWLYCEDCHHLFSMEPTDFDPEDEPVDAKSIAARPHRFPGLSTTINGIREYSSGNALLEIGVGAGEFMAVAREMMFDVTGIEIRPLLAEYARKTFDMNVVCGDFFEHNFDQIFDVIVMGDVLEHVRDPAKFLTRAIELSRKGTVLWISTPNFESAFSLMMGHSDPMHYEPGHCMYFSYASLSALLDRHGFDIVKYQISAHFNGSVEITAIRR